MPDLSTNHIRRYAALVVVSGVWSSSLIADVCVVDCCDAIVKLFSDASASSFRAFAIDRADLSQLADGMAMSA